MLHSVSDSFNSPLKEWCISKKIFLRFLRCVEEKELETTHFTEIEENKKTPSKKRKIIISFDDCPKLLFDFAIPELQKRKMKAVFYMPTAYLGGFNAWDAHKGMPKLELMNEGDLKSLVDEGMEIGSHSHHHIELKNVTNPDQLQKEITLSKAILESITQKQICSFSYPYGSVPKAYNQLLSNAGYSYGVAIYQPFETKLALRRFGVYEKDTLASINHKLSSRYQWSRKLYDAVKKN